MKIREILNLMEEIEKKSVEPTQPENKILAAQSNTATAAPAKKLTPKKTQVNLNQYIQMIRDADSTNWKSVLDSIPQAVKNSQVFWTKIIEEDELHISVVPEKFKTEQLCIKAVENDLSALQYVPENILPKLIKIFFDVYKKSNQVGSMDDYFDAISRLNLTFELPPEIKLAKIDLDIEIMMENSRNGVNPSKLEDYINKINPSYFKDGSFVDGVAKLIEQYNHYGQYNSVIADLLKKKGDSDSDVTVWEDIITSDLKEIYNIPENISRDENNAETLFDTIQESINLIDKHIFRAGDFEEWGNDIRYLIRDWVSENGSQLSKKLLQMLSNLDYSNVEGWAPKRR